MYVEIQTSSYISTHQKTEATYVYFLFLMLITINKMQVIGRGQFNNNFILGETGVETKLEWKIHKQISHTQDNITISRKGQLSPFFPKICGFLFIFHSSNVPRRQLDTRLFEPCHS